jgi:spermidine synthase
LEGIWFTEKQCPGLSVSCEITKVLHHQKTDYQDIKVVETVTFGKMLLLDNIIQTSIEDEFFYHEMISLPALNTHKAPENVLVIGGGDGGTIREVAKHPKVKNATLVEIDRGVVEVSKSYFPSLAVGFDSPKVKVRIEDGIEHVRKNKDTYDVVLIDSTDPIGPAVGLFSAEFYSLVYGALKDDGIFVAQTASPFFNGKLIRGIHQNLQQIFPIRRLYTVTVPTYPGGYWCFTLGSKTFDPLLLDKRDIYVGDTKYYSRDIHFAAFTLPPFVKGLLIPEDNNDERF